MTSVDGLEDLMLRCRGEISLAVNWHRGSYESVPQYLAGVQAMHLDLEGSADELAEPEIIRRMAETDTIIHLQFYPSMPIGSYSVWHYDLALAIGQAIAILDEREG